jgi:hypothetical protein
MMTMKLISPASSAGGQGRISRHVLEDLRLIRIPKPDHALGPKYLPGKIGYTVPECLAVEGRIEFDKSVLNSGIAMRGVMAVEPHGHQERRRAPEEFAEIDAVQDGRRDVPIRRAVELDHGIEGLQPGFQVTLVRVQPLPPLCGDRSNQRGHIFALQPVREKAVKAT